MKCTYILNMLCLYCCITCTNMVINYEGAMYFDCALYLNCYILRWWLTSKPGLWLGATKTRNQTSAAAPPGLHQPAGAGCPGSCSCRSRHHFPLSGHPSLTGSHSTGDSPAWDTTSGETRCVPRSVSPGGCTQARFHGKSQHGIGTSGCSLWFERRAKTGKRWSVWI